MLTRKGRPLDEERVSELRVEGQVMPPPPCAIVVHAAAWEDVGRVGVDTGQSAQIAQCVLVPHGGRCRRRTLLRASGRCCVKEPHFFEKLLRSRTYEQAARRPARPL